MGHLETHESGDTIPMQDWWDVEEQIFNALNSYLNTSPDSEVSTTMGFLRDSIVGELQQIVGSDNHESISKNIESQGNIFMFPLSDGRKLCFNILNFLKNPPEATYVGEYSELISETRLKWGRLSDHIKAMQIVFDANNNSRLGEGFLDDADTFIFHKDHLGNHAIYDEELLQSFDTKNIHEIQQLVREEYRDLIKTLLDIPTSMLPEQDRQYIAHLTDTYTQMVMGIGDYEGGATLFDKSESEVDIGLHISIDLLSTPQDVLSHWIGIRTKITENNYQDSTVENRAYPHYTKILNRLCYQKMLDLGASREQLLQFAKIASGHNDNKQGIIGTFERNFTPNHYDSELANTIFGNLIGMPGSREDSEENASHTNLIEKLIEHKVMRDIVDDTVLTPENLTVLKSKVQQIALTAGLEYPKYVNDNFFGGRNLDEVLTGSYPELSLTDKISVSSLARFTSYLDQSMGEYDSTAAYEQRQQTNSLQIQSELWSIGQRNIYYDEDSDTFILSERDILNRGQVNIKIPSDKVLNLAGALHYLGEFSQFIRDNKVMSTDSPGIYTYGPQHPRDRDDSTPRYSHEEIGEQMKVYQYGQDERDILQGLQGETFPEGYIDNLKNLSISESLDYVSDLIMAKFDNWDMSSIDNSEDGDEFINPEELMSLTDESGRVFSDTDIDILSTWANINGLGEKIYDLSDTNAKMAMTGLKIGIIIALSVVATYATAGAAGALGFQAAASLIRGKQVIDGTLQATMAGQMIFGGVMGAAAAPVSWVVYPHGYSSREEMIVDLLSDTAVSTTTGMAGGWLGMKYSNYHTAATIGDFTVLGLATEIIRMKFLEEEYHPEENFLDNIEIEG